MTNNEAEFKARMVGLTKKDIIDAFQAYGLRSPYGRKRPCPICYRKFYKRKRDPEESYRLQLVEHLKGHGLNKMLPKLFAKRFQKWLNKYVVDSPENSVEVDFHSKLSRL